MKNELESQVIERMMDRAIQINRETGDECRDCRVMTSPLREETLVLRWTTINITDIEKPVQCFHYECFNLDGYTQNCSVNLSTQDEANEFFWSLETLYKQEFANDHKL